MPSTIIDLDVLVPEEKIAKLGGLTYTLPGDMPMDLYLRLQRASGEDIDEDEATRILYEGIFDLFSTKIADDDEVAIATLKKALDSLGVRTFMKLFSEIYKEDEAEVAADPTPQTPNLTVIEGGTASSTQPPPTTA